MRPGETASLDMLGWMRDIFALTQDASDLPRLAEGLLNHMIGGFGADGGYLALPPEGQDASRLQVAAARDLPDLAPGTLLDLHCGPLGDGVAPMCVGADLMPDDAPGIFLPLIIKDRVVGALRLHRRPERPPFDAADWERGSIMVALLSLVIENRRLQTEQRQRIEELSRVNAQLESAHNQLLQSEKMASIGQLAAGVAHEINTPISYVHSNLGSLGGYIEDVFQVVDAYRGLEEKADDPDRFADVRHLREKLDLDYLKEDTHALLGETREGLTRVKKIVQDLKSFSHPGSEDQWAYASLEDCLDTTLNICGNEFKSRVGVRRQFSELPEVRCQAQALNQVFLNLLVNGAQAISGQGTLTVSTRRDGDLAIVEIADTGCGIRADQLSRVFDPFFTTKPVGKGTGLGLSLSYSIVKKHGGNIEVESTQGVGTLFRIILPIHGPA